MAKKSKQTKKNPVMKKGYYKDYAQEIEARAKANNLENEDTQSFVSSMYDLVETVDMVAQSVAEDISPLVDSEEKDFEAIETVYKSLDGIQDETKEKVAYINNVYKHLEEMSARTKGVDDALYTKINNLMKEMGDVRIKYGAGTKFHYKGGFSRNHKKLQEIREKAASIRNQQRQQELGRNLASEEKKGHVNRSQLVEEAQKVMGDMIDDVAYRSSQAKGGSSRNLSPIARKAITNDVLSLSLMSQRIRKENKKLDLGTHKNGTTTVLDGSGDEIGEILLEELDSGIDFYKFKTKEERARVKASLSNLNLSDGIRKKLEEKLDEIKLIQKGDKNVYRIKESTFATVEGRKNIINNYIKREGIKSQGFIEGIINLDEQGLSEAYAKQYDGYVEQTVKRRRVSQKEMETARAKMATHPVKVVEPKVDRKSGKAGRGSSRVLDELQRKRAGAIVAEKASNNDEKSFERLRSIRNSNNNPTFLDNLASDGEVVVVDIENWFDPNDPNNKNKNIPVTYADATYNAKEKKFDDTKYFYVKTSDLYETIKNMQMFLTSEHMGESRDIIAQELGFVDANGKALSAEDISKLDKKATYKFLKKFYKKKDKTTRLKNDATGEFTDYLNGIGFISPEEYTKRLENKTVVSANKEHDVPILSAFAGKQINVKELVDLFDLDSKKTGGAKLDRRMAGVTANVLAGFFDTPNMQAHNAGTDVISEASTLLAMSREREDVINFLNAEFEKALEEYEKENGVSALTVDGKIREEAKDWFRGYFAKRADIMQEIVAGSTSGAVLSGGLNIGAHPNASKDYKTYVGSGLEDFKATLSESAKDYFGKAGLGKRLETNITGIKPPDPITGRAGDGEFYVQTSASEELASLFQWANQNGFVVLYEKEDTGNVEKYNFYVIPEDQYDANDDEKNKANSYNFSWVAPNREGYLDSNNINSASQIFYDFKSKKYLDTSTYALARNVSTLKGVASRGMSVDKANKILSAQRRGILKASPVGYNGEKDYEQLNWDGTEITSEEATQEERARASGTMNWSASLYKLFEDDWDSKTKNELSRILGIKKDFNAWDFPQEIQYLFSRYLTQRTKNPEGYMEAIEQSDDEQLKAFVKSKQMKKIIESLDLFFSQGGGYYVDSLSARSAGTGKAFANAGVDLPFTDMLVMQAAGSENNSKAKANTPNRKVMSTKELLDSGIWFKSSLRDDSENSTSLVTPFISLPESTAQRLMYKASGGQNVRYHEAVSEERAFVTQQYKDTAAYYGNKRKEEIATGEINEDFLTSFGITHEMLDQTKIGSLFEIAKESQHPTGKDIALNDKLNIPKGSIITSIKKTENGIEVAYVPTTEIEQAQKAASTGTGKRWEQIVVTQQDIISAIEEEDESVLSRQEKDYLIALITDSKNPVSAFKMQSPKKRSMSFRTGGSENEGLWEYLVNQIKTKSDFDKVANSVAGFKGRYRWDEKSGGVKSNIKQVNGRLVTLDGQDFYSTDDFWGDIGKGKSQEEKEIERAAYAANVEKLTKEVVDANGNEQEEVVLGSMYRDAAKALGMNEFEIGRLSYEAINATSVSEFSRLSGIGKVDRGESRGRFSTRAKEQVREQINEILTQKLRGIQELFSQGLMTKEEADEQEKLIREEAEGAWQDVLQKYGGDDRDIDEYNTVGLASRKETPATLGLKDKRVYKLVFGGKGDNSDKLMNDAELSADQINISEIGLDKISAEKMGDTEYQATGLSKLYSILDSRNEELGHTAYVQLSFDGLDEDTKKQLIAAGYRDGQILAIGPEDEKDLSGKRRVDQNSRASIDFLRNAQKIVERKENEPIQLDDFYAKNYGNIGVLYQNEMADQTKQKEDKFKRASSKKAKMSGNLKVVAMDEDNDGYAVISYQGALDLLGLGANPEEEDVDSAYEDLLGAIKGEKGLDDIDYFKNLPEVASFKNKRFDDKKRQYQELVNTYVEQMEAKNLALPSFILRHPVLNESNLRFGVKINSKNAPQKSNVLMLPKLLAEQMKADFDGDMVQIFYNLATKYPNIFMEMLQKMAVEANQTQQRIEESKQAVPSKTDEDWARQFKQEAPVITNPQVASSFTNLNKEGQFGLGIASYTNTETQFNLRKYRELHNTNTPEQIIRDKVLGVMASSVVEQNGISAKKGLQRVLKNPNAAWDASTLDKLRDAFFNYRGTKEQDDLIGAYSEDFMGQDFENDPIIQTLISSLLNTYGFESMKESKIFDETKFNETDPTKSHFVLKQKSLLDLLKYVRRVNLEASGEKRDIYAAGRDQYFREINPGTVGGPSKKGRLRDQAKGESDAIDGVSSSLEEHNKLMPEAIRLEREKAKASENLSGASEKEAEGIDASTDAMKEHIATFEQYKKMAKFTGVDKLNVTRINDNNGGHYYEDENGERVMSFTQFARIAKGDTDDPRSDFVWEKAREAQAQGRVLTSADVNMSDEDFNSIIERMGSSFRGNVVHRVIELMGKSGLSIDDLMNGGWKNIADLQQDSEIQNNMATLSMIGLGDDYVQLDSRIESYLSALKDSGLSLTKAAEMVVGMVMHGNMGDIKVAGTFDNIFSYGNELVMGDSKNFVPKGTEAMQLAFGAMAASVNKELLESIFTSEQLATITPNMSKVIASITEQGTRMFQMSNLSENDLYALASYVKNRIETGKSPNLSATNEKSAMGQIAGVRGMGQTDEQRKEHGDFINQESKKQNTAIKEYKDALSKQFKYERDIARLRKDMEGQSGEQLNNSEQQLSILQRQLGIYSQIVNGYNRGTKTLNGIKLTDEQILTLEQYITLAQDEQDRKILSINNQNTKRQGLLSQIFGGFKNAFRNITDASLAYAIIGKIKQGINEIIQSTKELDQQIVNIQIATGNTRKETKDLLKEYSNMANELGRTTSTVASASNDWLRAGYEGKEAAELTKASMMLSTLGMIEASEATTYLISTLKGWKIEANEVIDVVDKLTAVDMSAAISAGDLALAMSRANSSARLAGSDMNNFIGYVTTIADRTQKSAESVGESMKTLYARYGNVKASKFVASKYEIDSSDYDSEEYENLNDLETVLDSVGIKMRNSPGQWKSADEVIYEIAGKWKGWDQTTQNSVATAFAGTRQRENFLTLMDSFDDVQKYVKIANNAYGTATQKMDAYTDSVEAAQERIQTAIEKWALFFDGAGIIKDFYSAISYVISNLHILATTLGALIVITKKDEIFTTMGQTMSRFGTRISEGSLIYEKMSNNLANNDYFNQRRQKAKEEYKQESWLKTQRDFYQNDFDRVMKENNISAENIAQYKDLQGFSFRLNKKDRKKLGQNLLSNKKWDNFFDELYPYGDYSIDKKSKNGIEAQNLASALLTTSYGQKHKSILETIASDKDCILTQSELEEANEALAEARKDAAIQEISRESEDSGDRLGDREDATRKGTMMAIGGAAGGIGVGYVLGDLLEGTQILGQDLGPVGQILGTTLGGSIGSSAFGALSDAFGNATRGQGTWKFISSLASGITGFGWLGIGITVASAFWAGFSYINKKKLEKLQEDFKELEEKYSSMKGSDIDAKQYDELAKGVDSLGNNLTLTDDEYQEFLDKSNALAELFPSLIVKTDEAGNKFVGLGGKVGGVSDEVIRLTDLAQKMADSALFKEDGFLWKKTSVFKDAYENAQKEAKDYKEQIIKSNRNIEFSYLNKPQDENGIFYEGYGADLIQYLVDKGYIVESGVMVRNNNKSTITENGEKVDQNRFVIDTEDFSESEIDGLNQAMDDFLGEQKGKLQEAQDGFDAANKSMQDYANAIIRQDTKLNAQFNNLSDNQEQFVNTLIPSIDITSMDDEEYQDKIKEVVGSMIDNIQDNAEYSAAIDYYFNPDMTISMKEFQGNRSDLLNLLATMLPGMTVEEGEKLLQTFGFKWDGTVDTNGDGKIDVNEIVDEQDALQKIYSETLNGKTLASYFPDLNKYANNFSVEETNAMLKILQNNEIGKKYNYKQMKEATFGKVIDNSSLTQLANLYEQYSKIKEEDLTDIDKIQKEMIEKSLDRWSGSLGVIKGQYDEIVKKAKAMGNLTFGGLTNMTPSEVEDKYSTYKEYYDYLVNDFKDNKGVWDTSKLSAISSDSDLAPLIGDVDALKEKIKGYLDNGEREYRKSIAEQVGATEEGYNTIMSKSSDLVEKFKEDYGIDLNNFKTIKTAENIINAYSTALMEGDYVSWLASMKDFYAEDLENFEGFVSQKAKLNSLIISQMKTMYGSDEVELNLKGWYQEFHDRGPTGGKINYNGTMMDWDTFKNTKIYEYQDKKFSDNLQTIQDRINEIFENPYSGLKLDFDGQKNKNKNNSDSSKTPYELLKQKEGLINQEFEAMKAYAKTITTGQYHYTEYFDKMRDLLNQEKSSLENEIAGYLSQDELSTEEQEKLIEAQQNLIETQVRINNLDDEEVEDKLNILNATEHMLGVQIALQKQLIETSDTEQERLEREKELIDLLSQEAEQRKKIRDYQISLIEKELEYNSMTPDNAKYKELMDNQIKLYQENATSAYSSYLDAINSVYNDLLYSSRDSNGNLKYTTEELMNQAINSEKAQTYMNEYIEAAQKVTELQLQQVNDELDYIQTKIDYLENKKPNEWSNIEDIKSYYDDTIDYMQQKLDMIKEVLKDTSHMTDEQIKDWYDKANDLIKQIHDAQIQEYEDIKEQDDKYYEALTWQVNQYIDELNLAKDNVDKIYDEEIKKLNDKNESLERTNKLLELQKNLKNSMQEKERVYREGIGWVYETPRQKVKDAQKELDDFYLSDKIDDLNNSKEEEDKILDERIQNWQDYLTMLENKYGEYEALENQRILMERMNVDTQEEIDKIIKDDMDDFTIYTKNKMEEGITNYQQFYSEFNSSFNDFFLEYKNIVSKIADANRELLNILNIDDYLNDNNNWETIGNGIGGTLTSEEFEKIKDNVNINHDYSLDMTQAVLDGDYESYNMAAKYRTAKSWMQGITLGEGGYRTNEQVYYDALEELKKNGDKTINGLDGINKNLEENKDIEKQSINATNQNTQTNSNLGNQIIGEQNESQSIGQSQDKKLSYIDNGVENVDESIIEGVEEIVDAINSQQDTIMISGGGGGEYDTVDDDPGVVGSSAWEQSIRDAGYDYGYGSVDAYIEHEKEVAGYSSGIKNGPVTYTGLAMLHGSPNEPEYVLNNDQAYNLLYNMSSSKMSEFEPVQKSDSGTQYIVQGDIILEGVDDPSKFWQEVTTAMGNRWNVTKNR